AQFGSNMLRVALAKIRRPLMIRQGASFFFTHQQRECTIDVNHALSDVKIGEFEGVAPQEKLRSHFHCSVCGAAAWESNIERGISFQNAHSARSRSPRVRSWR